MSLRAYVVKKEYGIQLFDCYHPSEWFDRLTELGKFDNGVWMEFTEDELQEMEADTENPLSEDEDEIIALIREVMEKQSDNCIYLEYH